MIEAGAVEETDQSKIAGKRPAQLYKYAQDSFDFHFPRILEYPRDNTNKSEWMEKWIETYNVII